MNSSTQLKALIRNMSKDKKINAQILLRNYMLERLLERIAVSKYRDEFILKGGMLVAAMVGIDTRSTMDMDATIKGQAVNKDNIENILNEIVALDIGDNVKMSLKGIEEIRDEAEYPGLRASIQTEFDGITNMLKLDMTTGDTIVPKEITYEFKLMFEDRILKVKAYSIETVLAEKIETVITRSTANTRMRDYYDVYIIMTMYKDLVNNNLLNDAITKVFENRDTTHILKDRTIILKEIENSVQMQHRWERYQSKYSYAKEIKWNDIIIVLKEYIWGKYGKNCKAI